MTSLYPPAVFYRQQPHLLLRIGQPVHVNHHATWRQATVTSLAARTVGVAYQDRPAAPACVVHAWAVRPADGVLLCPARQIRAGDQIIFGTQVHTAAAAPLEHGGWLTVTFTDSDRIAVVMPGAVLRLIDDTPQVSVNGQPLQLSRLRTGQQA